MRRKQSPDVTVMGAGIFGLSVAFACARRGAIVQVIEARRVGAGASGGLVGALAPHVPEAWNTQKAFQFRALLMAPQWWAGIAALGGIDPGHARLGRLQPLADEAAVARARARAETAAELWQGQARWRVVPVPDAGAMTPRSATGLVVHDTLSARLHPRRACAALAAALREMGAEVLEGRHADPSAGGGATVLATGWEGLTQAHTAGPPLGGGVKGQALALRLEAGPVPQVYADGLHIVPHADGTVAIGSTSERVFENPDSVDDAAISTLHARALDTCPGLARARVVARWAGVRPRARRRMPVLGPLPGRPGCFIANGGFKIGFGLAPAVGEAMADLILDGHDTIPAEFRPDAAD